MKETAREDGVYTITLCGGQEQKVSFWKDSPVGTLLLNCDMTPVEGIHFSSSARNGVESFTARGTSSKGNARRKFTTC